MDAKQRTHVMTLANSIIGVSILAMPYCFKQCGIILSILLLLFSTILCRLACHFLLKSAIKARVRTFEFLAYHVFGSIGKFCFEIGMIGFLLGTCVAFFVVMGDLGPQIVLQISEANSIQTLRTTILVVLAVFCVLPLGLLRNIDSLTSVCLATIGFYGILVIKIFLESVPQLFAGDWFNHVDLWRPAGVLQCIPIFSMAVFCQTQLFEIYQAIPNASLDKMNHVVKVAVNICTSVYVVVGVFGYIAVCHKPTLSGNILMDFQPSMVTETMKIGFVLSIAFSFPLVIFPCRASLFSLIYKPIYSGLHDSSSVYIPEGKFRILTLIIVTISLIIGILIPSIELVLGIVGSTIGILICVIFPATCFICLTEKNTNERIIAQVMLFIGIAVMVLGTYANLYAIETIDTTQNLDKYTPHQIIAKQQGIDDIAMHEKLEEIKQKMHIEEKEIQIKIPDGETTDIKEVRHEPPQPEEPHEVDDSAKIQLKDQALFNNEQKKEETPKLISNVLKKNVSGDQNAVEVDVEALKKEDREMANADAPIMEQQKQVAENAQLAEAHKQILKEKEKIKAVKNIQDIAQKAIDIIVDDEAPVVPVVEKAAVDQILDIVATKNKDKVVNVPLNNSAPLPYKQLNLQNSNGDVGGKLNQPVPVVQLVKSEDRKTNSEKRNVSVVDLINLPRKDMEEIKNALDVEILRQKLREKSLNRTIIKDINQMNGDEIKVGETLPKVDHVQVNDNNIQPNPDPEQISNESGKQLDIHINIQEQTNDAPKPAQKTHDQLGLGRDILSVKESIEDGRTNETIRKMTLGEI